MDAEEAAALIFRLDDENAPVDELSDSSDDEVLSSDNEGLSSDEEEKINERGSDFFSDSEHDDDDEDDDGGLVRESTASSQRCGRSCEAGGRARVVRLSSSRSDGRSGCRGRSTTFSGRGLGRGGPSASLSRGRSGGRARFAALSSYAGIDAGPTQLPTFHAQDVGMQLPAGFVPTSELDFFKLFMGDDVLNSIAQFTNMYAEKNIASKPSHANPDGTWQATDKVEIERLLALLFFKPCLHCQ